MQRDDKRSFLHYIMTFVVGAIIAALLLGVGTTALMEAAGIQPIHRGSVNVLGCEVGGDPSPSIGERLRPPTRAEWDCAWGAGSERGKSAAEAINRLFQ